MLRRLALSLPVPVRERAMAVRNLLRWLPYRGAVRHCEVCGSESSRFGEFGSPARPGAMCMRCGSLERHRFVWWYFANRTDLFDGAPKRMLHVAPESCFQPRLRSRLGKGYVTADISNPRADLRMDVQEIPFPDEHFDVVYCSHVLEHVPDDRRAMREFRRVLKSSGWAVLIVPVNVEVTFEDPSVTDPSERARLFGQADHVRRYGPDYADRLRDAGFAVEVTAASDVLDAGQIARMGLTAATGDVYLCTRDDG